MTNWFYFLSDALKSDWHKGKNMYFIIVMKVCVYPLILEFFDKKNDMNWMYLAGFDVCKIYLAGFDVGSIPTKGFIALCRYWTIFWFPSTMSEDKIQLKFNEKKKPNINFIKLILMSENKNERTYFKGASTLAECIYLSLWNKFYSLSVSLTLHIYMHSKK